MSEIDFTRALVAALPAAIPGLRCWRQNTGSVPVHKPMSKGPARYFEAGPPVGASDISGLISPQGWRLEVELKMPRRRRTAEQLSWAAFCLRSGAVYECVTYAQEISLEQNVLRAVEMVRAAIAARAA